MRRGTENHISHDDLSVTSDNNISKLRKKVNNIPKEAISQSEVASFEYKGNDIKILPNVIENDGIRTIGATRDINEQAFVEGIWEDSQNKWKKIVEKGRLENVENFGESGIIEETKTLTLEDLTRDVLRTKPPYSRIPRDWIEAGGSIAIDKSGNWIYTDWFGISIKYINGYPDYIGSGVVFQAVNIGKFTNRGIDKRLADKLAPNGPCKKGNVWHHSQDGHTMEEISREIHERFTHMGGISNLRGKK